MHWREKIIIKIFRLSLVSLLLVCGEAAAQTPPVGLIGSEQAHNVVWESKIYRQIEFLSDTVCHGRASGTNGAHEAASWIVRNFERMGIQPIDSNYTRHFYIPGGAIGRNVIGFMSGCTKRVNDRYVIIMAHYDGLGTLNGTVYPGADSNASGVAAMLDIADMFRTTRLFGRAYDQNILFVALDGKMKNMRGVKSLWTMLEEGRLKDPSSGKPITADKIDLVVNIDQIGSSLSPLTSGREDYILMLGRESLKNDDDALRTLNSKYGIGLEVCYDYYGSEDFTDLFYRKVSEQKVFVENRIPAVLFTSGITMKTNKPYDNAASLNMSVLKRRIWLMFHWIEWHM